MGDENKVSVQIKNGLLKVPKVINWIMAILSLYFSWISIKSGTITLEWYIIAIIIIGNGLFLIICSLYEGFLYKKFTAQLEKNRTEYLRKTEQIELNHKETLIEQNKKDEELIKRTLILTQSIEELKEMNVTMIKTYQEIINKYNLYYAKLQNINDTYVNKVKQLGRLNNTELDNDQNKELDKIKRMYDQEYIKSYIEDYNRFMGESTQNLKIVLDNYLKTKKVNLKVSIAIKQFNQRLMDITEIKTIKVMTTFRDKESYLSGREVGKKEYTIYGNTDFLHCLRNASYINNNLLKDDSYNNENINYKHEYTSTAVVPIVWEYEKINRFFGYLTCDVYDEEQKYTDVMDQNIIHMMNSVASILARYFDDIQYLVQNILYKDFISEVYTSKIGG